VGKATIVHAISPVWIIERNFAIAAVGRASATRSTGSDSKRRGSGSPEMETIALPRIASSRSRNQSGTKPSVSSPACAIRVAWSSLSE
jgi:hypothetical protein